MKTLLAVLALCVTAHSQPYPFAEWWTEAAVSNTGHNPLVVQWKTTVVAAGGAAPSETTLSAMDLFLRDIQTLTNKMLSVNCIAPDNLTAAITPLISFAGASPWTNSGFSSGQLSVNGLAGNSTSRFRTAIIPSSYFNTTNLLPGVTLYTYTGVNENVQDFGVSEGSTKSLLVWQSAFGSQTFWDVYNDTANQGRATATITNGLNGFFTFNRTATNYSYCAKATSTNGLTVYAASTGGGGTVPTKQFDFYDATQSTGASGTPASTKTYSFLAVHYGLTTNEASTLFSAVQSLRTRLGGGYR